MAIIMRNASELYAPVSGAPELADTSWAKATARRSIARSGALARERLQRLGRLSPLGEERIEGLGVAPLHTVREPGPRLIGNVSIEVDLGSGPRLLAGFENHGGRTYIDPGGEPLGRVLHGHGNNGRDGLEGIVRGNLIGTYLHGPLLPKNAWLADELIARAIERREGTRPELAPLDDRFEDAAHADAERAAARG